MSNDIFVPNSYNYIKFTEGEVLTADKLNALIDILQAQIEDIGKAIGDIRGESLNEASIEYGVQKDSASGVQGAVRRELDIASLGRIIGPASNLNPRAINQSEPKGLVYSYSEGGLEFELPFGFSAEIISIAGWSASGTKNFTEENQYYFENGKVLLSSKPQLPVNVAYTIKPEKLWGTFLSYQNASYNVIPDPNSTTDYLSITFNPNDSSYTVELPNVKFESTSSDYITSELDFGKDLNFNREIRLPEWVINAFSAAEDKLLPQGAVYLKNRNTKETYSSCKYYYSSPRSIKITELNLGTGNCLNPQDYALITVGTDITTTLADLKEKLNAHKHDGSIGEPRVSVFDLAGIFEGGWKGGAFVKSEIPGNPMPQYLLREGYSDEEAHNNGANAMLGDLLLGRNDFDPLDNDSNISDGDNSVKLRVGNDSHTVSLVEGELVVSGRDGVKVLSDNTVYVNGGTLSHIDSNAKIKTSILSHTQTEQYEINGSILSGESFSNANPKRKNNTLKVYREDDLVKESFMTHIEVKPSTEITYSNSSPATNLDTNGKLISLCNTALINENPKPLHSENSYKFKVLDIEDVYDNFYLDFKKNNFASNGAIFEDSRIGGERAASLETRFSTYSYYNTNATIVDAFEDVGGDLIEDPNVPFRFIQAREKIFLNGDLEQSGPPANGDLQNDAVEKDVSFLWTECSQRILINEWFNTETQDNGGGNIVKQKLWVNFESDTSSGSLENVSFRVMANFINSDKDSDEDRVQEYFQGGELEKTLGFIVVRGNDYRWIPQEDFALATVDVGYPDESYENPDGDLLTRIQFTGVDSRSVLMLNNNEVAEEGEVNSSKDFFDLLSRRGINIYMTRRPYYNDGEERSVLPTLSFIASGMAYYDFLNKIDDNEKREGSCYRDLTINNSSHHINKIGYLSANRFFVNIYRDKIVGSYIIFKRRFVIDTFNNELPIMQIYRGGVDWKGGITLLESVNFIWNLKNDSTVISSSPKEHEYLNLYKYGNGFNNSSGKKIVVKINGEKMLSYKCSSVNLSILFYKYIRNKMVQMELSDFGESVESYPFVLGGSNASYASVLHASSLKKGFFEIKYILDVKETYYRDSAVILDIKAEYDIVHNDDLNESFYNQRLINDD